MKSAIAFSILAFAASISAMPVANYNQGSNGGKEFFDIESHPNSATSAITEDNGKLVDVALGGKRAVPYSAPSNNYNQGSNGGKEFFDVESHPNSATTAITEDNGKLVDVALGGKRSVPYVAPSSGGEIPSCESLENSHGSSSACISGGSTRFENVQAHPNSATTAIAEDNGKPVDVALGGK